MRPFRSSEMSTLIPYLRCLAGRNRLQKSPADAAREFCSEKRYGAQWSLMEPHAYDPMGAVPLDDGDAGEIAVEGVPGPLEISVVIDGVLAGEHERRVERAHRSD
jgi:hypothetical protein